MKEGKAQKFWMIYSPANPEPTTIYKTPERAKQSATKFAKQNIGSPFFVLEAIEGFITGEPEIQTLDIDEFPEK